MAERMERWLVQIVVPEGTYDGADEIVGDLVDLVDLNSEMQIVSAELDLDQGDRGE